MPRLLVPALLCATALYSQKQPFDVEAMLKISRISEPQLSPDGKMVAFTVQTVDLEQNTKPKQIFTVPIEGGSAPLQITRDGSVNERPRWSPDSKRIFFHSNRTGSAQIWSMDSDGNRPKQITSLATETSGVLVTADGKKLVFVSSVYPDCDSGKGFDDACNKARIEEEKNDKVKARSYTTLLFRHWTQWQGKQRQHLLTVSADGGLVLDLTPAPLDVPPFSLGGPEAYAISPDSAEVAYTVNTEPGAATSTNSDIYTVPITGGDARKLTSNIAADNSPLYSPDGKYLAYRAQTRSGYESDRWRLVVIDRSTGVRATLTEGLDRSVEGFTWSPDSTRLFYTVLDRGRQGLQMIGVTGGAARAIINGSSSLDDVQFTADGKTLLYTEQSGSRPLEIFRVGSAGGSAVALTHLNDALLANYALAPLEEVITEGAEKTKIHSFVVKPPDFRKGVKYPVLFLIHGGPEGEWGESWSYRWNPQVFAAAGYVVVMPNPRGSTGYGQKFTDEVNEDWGGRAYEDIMAVADFISAQPYADPDRMAAAGGSYGGYMVDWILGHTNRFKALVSHAGVYDLRSEAGETEELWFPLWEFKGMPWENPDLYAKWSPSFYAKEFKTPTLVIHGEQDFRVPFGQGLQLYTALQMQKVPSKLLVYPDEGHWILKPRNSVLWYRTFLEWVGEWTKKVLAAPVDVAAPAITPKP